MCIIDIFEVNKMDILKLKPVFKDYIWGGTRLKTDFGFKSDLDVLAESGSRGRSRTFQRP